MKLVTFSREGGHRLGVLDGAHVLELEPERGWSTDMVDLVAGGRPALAEADLGGAPRHRLEDVVLEAPLMPRKNVFAVGRNYLEHVHEVKEIRPVPEHPVIFTKPPTAVIGPNRPIDTPTIPPIRWTTRVSWRS